MISFIKFFFYLPDHIWKMNYSLNLITGCDRQPFEITGSVFHIAVGAHSHSFQNYYNSATLEGFQAWATCLRKCQSISIRFKSWLWPGHPKTSVLTVPTITLLYIKENNKNSVEIVSQNWINKIHDSICSYLLYIVLTLFFIWIENLFFLALHTSFHSLYSELKFAKTFPF